MTQRHEIRQQVWEKLLAVAKPDSRFHLDFNEYIPDFDGSDRATERLLALPEYQECKVLFVTPDNGLELFRAENIRRQKLQIITTYGIRRGFIELRPEAVPAGHEDYAALLDVMEKFGKPISLAEIAERYTFDLLVTGAAAISTSGVRFGKGHGYFDMEWGMLTEIGAVQPTTPIVGVVHDVQVLDFELEATPHDVVCDIIVTPTRTLRVPNAVKPDSGILWDQISPETLAAIPPLRELKRSRYKA